MDSKIKGDYLASEQISKSNDSTLVWEDQKRKWENQLMYTTQQLAAQFTPWLPIINPYQPTGPLDYTPVDVNWHSPQPISNNYCLIGASEDLKATKTQDFPPSSSWHIPQTFNDDCCIRRSDELKTTKTQEFTSPPNASVKCYVCDEHVLRNEFALHLFFGELRCNDCQIKVLDCKTFRSDLFRSSNCIHKHLIWSENPIEFLKSHLYVTSKSDYKKIYHYFRRLKSLEQLLPWKFVFQEYRIFKNIDSSSKIKCEPVVCDTKKCEEKIINTNNNCEEVLLDESFDLGQMEDAVQVIDLVDLEMYQENYTNVSSESPISDNKHTIKVEQIIKELDTSQPDCKKLPKVSETIGIKSGNVSNQGSENNNINILQNSSRAQSIKSAVENSSRAQSIKSAVENILLKDKLFKENNAKKEITFKQKPIKNICNDNKTKLNLTERKPIKQKKRKYKKKIDIIKESVEETLPMESELEFLELPDDGNYLVTYTAPEECPMCYKKINLYNCRVNLKLLLYTFWCKCGLKIFYLRKTPANIEHPVKIILDE